MQKPKIESFRCNKCFGHQGAMLLDCFCLFCTDCFKSSNIEAEYAEKIKHLKKGKPEKCGRCNRNTEYKIFDLNNKTQFDQSKFLFSSATGGIMSFFRLLEFQMLQKNREIQHLSTSLHSFKKKLQPMLTENPQLNKYFNEKEIESIKMINKKPEGTPSNVDPNNQQNKRDQKNGVETNRQVNTKVNPQKDATNIKNNEISANISQISAAKSDTENVRTPVNKFNKAKEPENLKQITNFKPDHSSAMIPEPVIKKVADNNNLSRMNYINPVVPSNLHPENRNYVESISSLPESLIIKGLEQKLQENQQKTLYKKALVYAQISEYETPIIPQLKKPKIMENVSRESHQQEELKKLFGFEVKEIKKTNSNRPSTERPNNNDKQSFTKPKPINPKTADSMNYWGRGYHLNYPNYA